MKRKSSIIFIFLVLISVFTFNTKPAYADNEKIYLGGMPAGFSLYTRGAHVVGLCDVITENGLESPAKNSEIKIGDIILAINEYEINNAQDIEVAIKDGQSKNLSINRNGKIISEKILPAKDMNGAYKLGVFIRDCVNGIGTITYIKGNKFASLGHPVLDDNGEILNIIGGNLYNCNITGYIKGERGKAGELRGVFLNNTKIAQIDENRFCGVFGVFDNNYIEKNHLIETEIGNACVGDAHIISTINGDTPQKYEISIIKIDTNSKNKNFIIRINDKDLINNTGGIVQGMSGSPIIQNGKLVGAVTHVFINDPTRGFGISIDKMLDN